MIEPTEVLTLITEYRRLKAALEAIWDCDYGSTEFNNIPVFAEEVLTETRARIKDEA